MASIEKTPRMTVTAPLGGAETPSTSKAPDWTPDEMKAFLNDNFLSDFDVSSKSSVKKGDTADTPRQDGAVRNRSEGVKSFFKSIGQGIGSFLSSIGNAISTAFAAIKEAVTTRNEAPTPRPNDYAPRETAAQKQTAALKDFCVELSNSLEKDYKAYLKTTQDEPPMTRTAYVKNALPDPETDTDDSKVGSDPDALSYIGDKIDGARALIPESSDPGLTEMRNAVLARFEEVPTLDLASDSLFKQELRGLNSDNAATFLRTDCAYTKLDKFEMRKGVELEVVARDVTEDIKTDVHRNRGIATNGLAVSSMTKDQSDALYGIVDKMLDTLLDTDFDNPNAFINQISDEYRAVLSDKAEQINSLDTLGAEDKKDVVQTLYINSLFLRGISGELSTVAPGQFARDDEKAVALTATKVAQTFFNGNSTFPMGKGSDDANAMLQKLADKHQPRMMDFLVALGLPPPTPDDEKVTV